jgi:outer membrane protein OmpA-like peptidoglycan-associated protein
MTNVLCDFLPGATLTALPATAISVVGKGEKGLLVPTPDGVREPQNRRVEIVIH